jgi:high-affinity nickel-transport protein
MTIALSYMLLGFLLGLRHAVDADHVIAVTSIVTRQRSVRAGILIGAVWGLGHSITILIVGGAIVVFRVVIPPMLGLTMEMMVAVMLVMLGVWNLRELRRRSARHAEAGAHHHAHHVVRPLAVGLVHGLAGSAAVALLVLGVIEDTRWAVAYLVLFGAGTIVGMMAIAAAIAAPLTYASQRSPRVERHVRMASGLLSVVAGLVLVYQVGFTDGLFTTGAWRAPR